MVSYNALNFSFPAFSSVMKASSWPFFMLTSALKILSCSSILIKSFVFESFTNILLSLVMFSFIKDGSSWIFVLIVCGNLRLVCILITFALHDRNTILSCTYKTKTSSIFVDCFWFFNVFFSWKINWSC